MGSRFQTFLTTTDYFSNAILYLPWLFAIIYFFMSIGTFCSASADSSLFFMDEFWIFSFIIPGIVAWLALVVGRLPYANAGSDALKLAHRAMVIVPIVVLISFGWGITQGQSALKTFDEPYAIELKAGDTFHRVLLKGLLTRDPVENRVEFIKWDELTKLYRYGLRLV